MRLLGVGVVLRQQCLMRLSQTGDAKPSPGRAGRPGRRAGKRPQGMAKRLTFTEGRLRLPIGTTRPESQAFRQPRGGPIEAALILRLLPIKRKEQKHRPAGLIADQVRDEA